MNKLTETAPEEIHLCIGDCEDAMTTDFNDFGVTWADHAATAVTVRYVRADLVEKSE